MQVIKRIFVTFCLSFGAVLAMLFLYVFLPQYLARQFLPGEPTLLVDSSFRRIINNPPPSPSPTPSPTPGLIPATVIIPKLNIQAPVELVGVTDTNNMDVPKNAANLAWYMYGPKPSEPGNAVIAGHYDTPTGRPAVFYNLTKLEKGDEIEVISENAVRSVFVVTETASIPYDQFPNDLVFKSKPGINLNLITCGGIWDAKKKNYSERIVVYTTLKSELGEGAL